MSGFGLLAILLFLMLTGGLVALEYSNNSDLGLARSLMFILYLLVFFELVLALYEYPCYAVTGIVFISMGYKWLAGTMFAILGAIILFVLILIIVRIKWRGFLTPNTTKLIITGIILVCLLGYTELYNGAYSFDSLDDFRNTKEIYAEYDDHFFPTKYIYHLSGESQEERIAVLPFDVTTAAGRLPLLYKAETYYLTGEDGSIEIFFYPFTWKLYEGSDPVAYSDSAYVPAKDTSVQPDPPVSAADTSAADAQQS